MVELLVKGPPVEIQFGTPLRFREVHLYTEGGTVGIRVSEAEAGVVEGEEV
jgi:hypothetical protein